MKLVVFGLTVSSSWGNGHATLWRGLARALAPRRHEIVFFEKDQPYYRRHRDLDELPGGRLVLYGDWSEVREQAERELLDADVGLVTSYCPDGLSASASVLSSRSRLKVFYDLDTPVTLEALEAGQRPPWLGDRGLADFDLVLSFTGGAALDLLRQCLGARRVAALYGHVDPSRHRPEAPVDSFRGRLSYLGTYSADRAQAVEELFLEPARRAPGERFVLGGALYPDPGLFPGNVSHLEHVAPANHGAFFCSSTLTLNVTRQAMARLGYCPSGRLFEAAACAVPLLSDWFEGLDQFFEPRKELQVVGSCADVLAAFELSDAELARASRLARERTLEMHSSGRRALELEQMLEDALRPPADAASWEA
jgi:spore maturation protein CgeB